MRLKFLYETPVKELMEKVLENLQVKNYRIHNFHAENNNKYGWYTFPIS